MMCLASFFAMRQRTVIPRVKWLLKDRPNLVFSKSNRGWTPLYWAVVSGHRDVAEFLLADQADVNARDDNTWPLLHTAAYLGDEETTELLLTHGAVVDATNNRGTATLFSAKSNVVELLLAHGANVNVITSWAAHHCTRRRLGAIKRRRSRCWPTEPMSTPGTIYFFGDTPLLSAAQGCKDVTGLLLAHGADINARQFDGTQPVDLAAMMGYESEAEFLLAHGADINARDKNGITPLRWAMQDGHKDLAKMLRQHGGHE